MGTFGYRQIPQCRVCASPHRAKIERLWAEGVPPALILRRLPADHGISRQSLSRHLNRKHTPVDRRLVARRAEVRAEKRWEEVGRPCTVFAAEQAELASWAARMMADMLDRGELNFSEATLIRVMEMMARWDGEDRKALRARQEAEELTRCLQTALVRLFDALRYLAGDALTHEVIAHTRRDWGAEDILRLPGLEGVLKWHIRYVNSPSANVA
jgi:hypothetical protein